MASVLEVGRFGLLRFLLCVLGFLCVLKSSLLSAQTSPIPAFQAVNQEGFLPRTDFAVTGAVMEAADPRFWMVERGRADVDVLGYPAGRVNFFPETELVMGSERRRFDLNQATTLFELSASWRVHGVDVALVGHHMSRHVVDREFDRVPAWHTIGIRAARQFLAPRWRLDLTGEYGWIVQHTFVDYRSTSQLTARFETLGTRARLFVTGSTGIVGVDRAPLDRGRQFGARIDGGIRLFAGRGALDVFAAFERRVDGYPTGREPSSWSEFGLRLGTR